MANLETWAQNQESFETIGARELTEQERETMFNDDFFDNLKSDDPLEKIQMQEIDWKVYFQKPAPVDSFNPETSYTKVRFISSDGVFVDRFYVRKEDWENILNRRNNVNWAVQSYQTEARQLEKTVQNNAEILWSSVEARVDNLLNILEDLSNKWPLSKRPWESARTKERFKAVIRNDIAYLQSIKRELKRYNYIYEPELFQRDLDEIEWHIQLLEEARQIITKWWNTSRLPTILASLGDVKRADKFENKMAKYNQNMNEILKDATLKRLWNEDMEWLQDYLQDVRSGKIEHPSLHPFYMQHMADFAIIQGINPNLYATITSACVPMRRWQAYSWVATPLCPWARQCERQPWVLDKGGEMLADWLAKIWLIDENDTTKKEAWSKFGKVALLWLGAFAIYKIFTEKWWKRRAWIGGTAAAVLWMAHKEDLYKRWNDAIWKSNPTPQEVLYYANNAAGNTTPMWPEVKEIMDNRISPATTTIAAIGNININSMIENDIISKDNTWKFVFYYDNYVAYVEANEQDPRVKEMNLQAAESLKKNPTWLHEWLICLWIANMDALQKLWQTADNLLESNTAINYINNISSPINAEISKQWFKPKDNASWYQIMLENGDKTSISNKDMARYIKEWLVVLKDDSLAQYLDSPIINLEWKCMVGCENMKFDTIEELLKAVKLTTWIMEHFKWRKARDNHPFHLWAFQPINNWLIWNIQFNDGIITDIDVIRSNPINNTLKEISPTLNNNKHMYVNYLNNLWNDNRVFEKLNLSLYPILGWMWIDFYNKEEADDAEKWLTDIKEWNKFTQATMDWQPFTVKRKFQNLWDSLVFTAVNGDKLVYKEDISSRFPTLVGQQDKFLNYLNDPRNNMWASAIV